MGSAKIQVSTKTLDLIKDADYTDWSDEELMRGQQKDKRGRFNGQLPKVVPMSLLQELNRRKASKAIKELTALLDPAVDYIGQVIRGEVEADEVRLRSCEALVNRILGKAQERIVVTQESESAYQRAGVKRAVVLRDIDSVIDVSSREVTDDDEEDPFE